MNKLLLLMEAMPQHSGVPPHFGHQDTAYFYHHYKNCWTDCCGPKTLPPRCLDLKLLDFLWRSTERDDLQDQSTHDRGSLASYYEYCC
jgi:hypothetical protein